MTFQPYAEPADGESTWEFPVTWKVTARRKLEVVLSA